MLYYLKSLGLLPPTKYCNMTIANQFLTWSDFMQVEGAFDVSSVTICESNIPDSIYDLRTYIHTHESYFTFVF